MYTTQKTELGKLRAYERELTGRYAAALLRRRSDDAKSIFQRRRSVRRAILQREEWQGEGETILQLPRQAEVAEDMTRVA